MSKPSLLLIGAGGHAKSCIDVIEQQNKYQIFGLVGSPDEVGSQIFNHKVQFVDESCPNWLISPNLRLLLLDRLEQIKFEVHCSQIL